MSSSSRASTSRARTFRRCADCSNIFVTYSGSIICPDCRPGHQPPPPVVADPSGSVLGVAQVEVPVEEPNQPAPGPAVAAEDTATEPSSPGIPSPRPASAQGPGSPGTADEVSNMDIDDDAKSPGKESPDPSSPSGGRRLPGPKVPFHVILVMLMSMACLYDAPPNKQGKTRKQTLQGTNARLFLAPAIDALLNCLWQPGDDVGRADDFYGNGKAGFIHGIALITLLPNFPVLCGPVAGAILGWYGLFFYTGLAMWAYLAGYFDGDGSISSCKSDSCADWPVISFALKGPSALKSLICRYCPKTFKESNNNLHVDASFSNVMKNKLVSAYTGLKNFTVLKWLQVNVAIMFCQACRLGEHFGVEYDDGGKSTTEGTHLVPAVKMAKVMMHYVLSFLNRVHGATTSTAVHSRRLWSMATYGITKQAAAEHVGIAAVEQAGTNSFPIVVFLYIAGMFGSDGSIGLTGKDSLGNCYLWQSNKTILEAIASILNTLLGFENDPILVEQGQRDAAKLTPRQRATYFIKLTDTQLYPVIFTVGLLDYNRAPQWILTLALRYVVEDKSLDKGKREKVKVFLKDMLVWIKEERPS